MSPTEQNFIGVIIEESLTKTDILNEMNIISTEVEQVTEKHQTPHLKQWTLHTIEISADKADQIAEKLSQVLIGDDQTGHWYADYKNDDWVYIIFPHKIFKLNRHNSAEFQAAKEYGLSLGIPEYQVNFSPDW